jgi:GT2 family glycosyltransferase
MTPPPAVQPAVGVSIVVLNWNRADLTARCLDHLAVDREQVRVLVVDNGSAAADRQRLAAACAGRAEVLWLPRNLGFAGGMNAGLERALAGGAEAVWLLNNDAFPDPGCLAALTAALTADPSLGAVSPLLYDDAGEQHAGARFDWRQATNHTFTATQQPDPLGPDHWLTGTALLVRADALRRVGGFDPRYFAYWEDVDLCFRLTAAGYRLRAVPKARCRHLGSASTGGKGSPVSEYLMARNRWRFMRSHGGRHATTGRLAIRHVATAISRAGWLWAASPAAAQAALDGGLAGLLGRQGSPQRPGAPRWTRLLAWIAGPAGAVAGYTARMLDGPVDGGNR